MAPTGMVSIIILLILEFLVFCTVHTLVTRLGVSPGKLMMCFPQGTYFDDPKLEAKVDEILETMGVRTYRHYTLANFGVDENGVLTKVYLNVRLYFKYDAHIIV
jgi:hypothetical protein